MVINSTKLFLSKNSLYHNVDYLKETKKKKLLPVVKANGYGHGMEEIVGALYFHGQKEYAVARYVEAERIRKMGLKDIRILVFESIGDYSLIENKEDIDISVNNINELKSALKYGIPSTRIQIKIDFGFGRNGIYPSEITELKKIIDKTEGKFRGLYSHLFAVNYEDGLLYIKQFNEIVDILGKDKFEMIHLQNSAATLTYDCKIVTHIRAGMLIYGLQDDGFYERNLKQIFSLESEISSIRNLENSKYIAYNLKKSDCNAKHIAKIKLGYADGFLKSNEGSFCLIGNREYKILQVTMDNTFLEVDESIREGDSVLLYHNVSLAALHNKMTIYELLTILSPRIPRVFR
ncbi:alanine racemase [uncultured Fusobacterium sp.]|mgnify:FL=1|jgi:alanine racemase|uniref:alanine racemase n=1 Tax=uncultured Fusobacterium sp. TaxID=159267 RepID=UPI002589816D|nr:alanine racemase [uncultured Fusobacterium sp.]